jgi:hypothetical protein
MARALVCGLAILVAVNLLWFIALQFERYWTVLAFVIWASPFASSALASYLAPRHKLVLGLSMTIPAVLSPLAFHGLYQLRAAKVDFPGLDGAMSLAAIITPFALLLCAGGALAGMIVARRLRKATPPRA